VTFRITEDGQRIQLVSFDLNMEKTAFRSFFTKKSKAAEFNVLVDRGLWDGMDKFVDEENSIAIGLWKELENFAKKTGFECDVPGLESHLNTRLPQDKYLKYVDRLLSEIVDERGLPISARDYQIEGAYRGLKYKFCTQELATSAGKTLIFYIYNSFLRDAGRITSKHKALVIVPNVSLVAQTAEKFELYSVGKRPWKVVTIGGKSKFKNKKFQKKFEESEIVISTYQSLQNIPPEVFEVFRVVNVDECHKSRGEVIRAILLACKNWEYRLGLSGTVRVEEKYSDFFRVQETVGPLVMVLPAKHLIDNEYSPNIKIKILDLIYDTSDPYIQAYWKLKEKGAEMYATPKAFGKDMLSIERQFLFDNEERLDMISRLIKGLGKNALVLFSDVKNGYGKRIHEKLLTWTKNAFYIDGSVDSTDRDIYKNVMENAEYVTYLDFKDKKVCINQYDLVPLTDGTTKMAKDLQLTDDILDSWIETLPKLDEEKM